MDAKTVVNLYYIIPLMMSFFHGILRLTSHAKDDKYYIKVNKAAWGQSHDR